MSPRNAFLVMIVDPFGTGYPSRRAAYPQSKPGDCDASPKILPTFLEVTLRNGFREQIHTLLDVIFYLIRHLVSFFHPFDGDLLVLLPKQLSSTAASCQSSLPTTFRRLFRTRVQRRKILFPFVTTTLTRVSLASP